jgi:hypothetical protein
MTRIYMHPALEYYSSFYGMEKFIGVPQFSFAFQTVYTFSDYVRMWFRLGQINLGFETLLLMVSEPADSNSLGYRHRGIPSTRPKYPFSVGFCIIGRDVTEHPPAGTDFARSQNLPMVLRSCTTFTKRSESLPMTFKKQYF